jgi:hypothetical protein
MARWRRGIEQSLGRSAGPSRAAEVAAGEGVAAERPESEQVGTQFAHDRECSGCLPFCAEMVRRCQSALQPPSRGGLVLEPGITRWKSGGNGRYGRCSKQFRDSVFREQPEAQAKGNADSFACASDAMGEAAGLSFGNRLSHELFPKELHRLGWSRHKLPNRQSAGRCTTAARRFGSLKSRLVFSTSVQL